MTEEYDAATIGAYAADDKRHRDKVVLELNDGEPLAIVYLEPEEARELAKELVTEAETVEHRTAA